MNIKAYLQKKRYESKLKKLAKSQLKTPQMLAKEIAFELCLDDIEPVSKGKDKGLYVIINGEMIGQGFLIAYQDKYNPLIKGFDQNYNIGIMDRITNLARICGASVILSHNEIPLPKELYAKKQKDTHKKIEMVKHQVNSGQSTASNSIYVKPAEKESKEQVEKTYDGDEYYSWFALPCLVLSQDKKKVDDAVSAFKTELTQGGLGYYVPRYAMLDVVRAVIPFSNQINPNFLQVVSGRAVSSLVPLRNPRADNPRTGVIVCTDEATGTPVNICPSKKNPENTLIMAPPGSGKTTMICNIAAHAIANGDDVKIIEPKNEDSDGTDYLNFVNVFKGEVARWGPEEGDVSPNLLIIPVDKRRMGKRIAAYRKAKNDHFETIQHGIKAWIGSLNERQSGILTSSLIDLYIERKILDEEGEPLNYLQWDEPGALLWPSFHEMRMYWRKLYKDGNSEFYHDASLDALIMKTMNARPGGGLWWWANSHQHMDFSKQLQVFDISQVPDVLKSTVAIQIMGACNILYYPKNDKETDRLRTYLIYDEIGRLCQTPELIPYMEKSLREGRAPAVTAVFATQDPLIDKRFLDILRANCKNLFLLSNLNETNIDIFMNTFNLEEKYRSRLMQQGNGIGLYFRSGIGQEVIIELDEMVKEAVLNSQRGNENTEVLRGPANIFEVESIYQEIFDNEGFFIPEWLVSKEKTKYPGFKFYNPQDPLSRSGTLSAWIKESLIEEREGVTKEGQEKQDLIGVEGEVHYCAVCRIAGWMRKHGFPNVKIHHNNGPDITWGTEAEEGGCIEYEGKGTHKDVEDWNGKLKRARECGYKHIIFTGHSTTCKLMEKEGSEVSGFVYPQGEKYLLAQLERIRDEYKVHITPDPSVNNTCAEQTEA